MNTKNKKKKYIIGVSLVIVFALVIFFVFRNTDGDTMRITVEQKDIIQTVLAAGNTKAVDTVDLGFETSGRVVETYVDVGDRVTAGQLLVELDSSELQADLLAAQADLAEELANTQTDSVAINDAVQNAKIVISDSYVTADNEVRESVDQFFNNPGGGLNTNFKPMIQDDGSGVNFSVSFNDRVSINTKRKKVQDDLDAWKVEIDGMTTNSVDTVIQKSETYLLSVQDLIDKVSTVIFTLESPSSEYNATVAGFKSDISTARSNVTNALSDLVAAREKLNNAKAGQTSGINSVSAQSARKMQIEAQIKNIQAQISKKRIAASFDGIVTKQDVEQGEIVTSGTTIVSIISDNNLEIESNISEVNIGKITVGNPVEITFDAFPGETFLGTVAYIDPGETLVDGVVNYKIKVTLSSSDTRVKSGLTVNLNIETARKSQIIAIPLYAISSKPEGSFVKKIVGENIVETPVVLGVIGRDGFVEILSGLSVGDQIEIGKVSTQ